MKSAEDSKLLYFNFSSVQLFFHLVLFFTVINVVCLLHSCQSARWLMRMYPIPTPSYYTIWQISVYTLYYKVLCMRTLVQRIRRFLLCNDRNRCVLYSVLYSDHLRLQVVGIRYLLKYTAIQAGWKYFQETFYSEIFNSFENFFLQNVIK